MILLCGILWMKKETSQYSTVEVLPSDFHWRIFSFWAESADCSCSDFIPLLFFFLLVVRDGIKGLVCLGHFAWLGSVDIQAFLSHHCLHFTVWQDEFKCIRPTGTIVSSLNTSTLGLKRSFLNYELMFQRKPTWFPEICSLMPLQRLPCTLCVA